MVEGRFVTMLCPMTVIKFPAETMKVGTVFSGPFRYSFGLYVVLSVERFKTNRVQIFWFDPNGKIECYTYDNSSMIHVSSIF